MTYLAAEVSNEPVVGFPLNDKKCIKKYSAKLCDPR